MSTRKIRLSGMVAFLVVSLFALTAKFGAVPAHALTTWPIRTFAPYNFDISHYSPSGMCSAITSAARVSPRPTVAPVSPSNPISMTRHSRHLLCDVH